MIRTKMKNSRRNDELFALGWRMWNSTETDGTHVLAMLEAPLGRNVFVLVNRELCHRLGCIVDVLRATSGIHYYL